MRISDWSSDVCSSDLVRYAATGSVEPAKQGRPRGSGKLGPYRQAIVDKVKAKPDITMPDLAVWLEARHGVSVDPSNLSKFLGKEGFKIGRAHVWTPVTNAHLVCRLLLEKKNRHRKTRSS